MNHQTAPQPYKKRAPGDFSSGARIGGGYLLSHFRSTIGVDRFNFSVRNGKRWSPVAVATLVRSARARPRSGGTRRVR